MSRKLRTWFVIAGALAIMGVALWLALSGRLDRFSDWDTLSSLLAVLGRWSLPFLVAAQAIQVLIPVIPSQLLGMAAGVLYGTIGGTLVCLVGVGIGSWLAIRLARRYGRPYVERHATPETIDRIDQLAQRYGTWAFFFVALIPILPTDVGCFVAGLTKLRTRSLMLPIMLGRLPGVLILNLLGATSTRISFETMVVITAFTLATAAILFHIRDKIEAGAHRVLARLNL